MLKKMIVGVCSLAIAVALVGCGNQPFTPAQEKEFMEEYMTMAMKPSEPDALEKKMKSNLKKLSKDEASNAVDGLLYAMYQNLPTLSKKADGMQDAIFKEKEKNVDLNDSGQISKISDPTLKAFVGEVLRENYYFVDDNGRVIVQPNMTYMLEKYESYMTDSLKAMVEFSRDEFEGEFYNAETSKFELDIVVNRIIKLEENLNKYSNTYYKESFMKSKEYYYQIYFGMNNDLIMDSQKGLLPEVIAHYEKTVKEYPTSQLSKDLSAYLERLKKTNHIITDDLQVYLAEMTSVETIDVVEEGDSESKNNAHNELKDAIQEAIKENK